MAILTQGERISVHSVPVDLRQAVPPPSTLQQARETAERDHILRALEQSNWNVSSAARILNMERTTLHKRIRALGLQRA
jgi:transcriptional regulator of acetoin/glycerol metabolism